MSTLTIVIQHSAGSSNHYNKARKGTQEKEIHRNLQNFLKDLELICYSARSQSTEY